MTYNYHSKKKIVCRDTGEECTGSNYLSSKHWKKLRKAVYNSNDGTCERCGAVLPSAHMHVHHKTYKHIGDESAEELCLLCENCHSIIHGKKENEDGDKTKEQDYFIKKNNPPKRKKVKKRTCRMCRHMKMIGVNGKIKYKCELDDTTLEYATIKICGNYAQSNKENMIRQQIKRNIALELKDGKTIDQLNQKYKICKKDLAKMIEQVTRDVLTC